MIKKKRILTCVLAILYLMGAKAQSSAPMSSYGLYAQQKMSGKERADANKLLMAQAPPFTLVKVLPDASPAFREITPVVPYRSVNAAIVLKSPASTPTFWSILAKSDAWPMAANGQREKLGALINFKPEAAPFVTSDSIIMNPTLAVGGGAGVKNGVYYKTVFDFSEYSLGRIKGNLYSYDITTWEPTSKSPQDISTHLDYYASEVAQAQDGTVYGQFYSQNFLPLQYGTIDYETLTRTTLGNATTPMVAMGVTSDDRLFGIGNDGYLYQISTIDGSEVAIGYTGIIVSREDGYYGQTGEIDPATNTFYWACIDAQGQTGLYTVDLSTGAATKIGDFDAANVQMYDMVLAGRLAEDGVPAAATNLHASFPNGGNNGTVSFQAPSETYGGATLTGNLSYTVSSNGSVVANGTVAAGAIALVPIANAADGMHKYIVTTANDAGTSPIAFISAWVGYDVPAAPAKVAFSVDNANKATIRWNAVKRGVHNGFMGPLSYEVVRIGGEDTTIVVESTADTTATEQIPAEASLASYRYAVRAFNGEKTGYWADSESKIIGSAVDVPYLQTFDDYASTELFTVIDANNDGKTWQYDDYHQFMSILYNTTLDMDDWLITPPLKMEAGRAYILTFKARGINTYPERISVSIGKGNTVGDLTTQIVSPSTVIGDTLITAKFTAKDAGNCYIGFHGCSDADMDRLMVDSISVMPDALPTSPAAPTLTVTPDAKGALTAQIDVVAPTKQFDGNDLPAGAITKIDILRNGAAVRTFYAPANGARLSFTDQVPKSSLYKYTAIPYRDDKQGDKAEETKFVGLDMPLMPQHAKATDNDSYVRLSWDAIGNKGANGGYVDSTSVYTYIYNTGTNGQLSSTPSDSVLNGTSYDIAFNTNEGAQTLRQWGIANTSSVGTTATNVLALPVGKPDELPFVESVAGGKFAHNWWHYREGGTNENNLWQYTSYDAADNDGGSFIYLATASGVSGSLCSYKISLKDAVTPMLAFSYNVSNSTSATSGRIHVDIQTPDGTETTVYSASFTEEEPWTQHLVDLSAFAGKPWVIVKFHIFSDVQPVTVGIDGIRLQSAYSHDLSTTLTVPSAVVKGQDINVVAKVDNDGRNAESYTLNFYADDQLLKTVEVASPLAVFADTAITTTIPTSSVADKDKSSLVVKAIVDLDGDQNNAGNTASETVVLEESEMPSPRNLTAEPSNHLLWQAPEVYSETFTDDFEQYTPFASPFGNWTTIDGNPECILGSFFKNDKYPGQWMPGSFVVFDADAIQQGAYDTNPVMQGHNASHRFAAAPYELTADGQGSADANNYLVSPHLSGSAQTIKFYAKNAALTTKSGYTYDYPETFEVLASKSGNAREDFTTTVREAEEITGGEWREYNVDLPVGTVYFAIHQLSSADANTYGNYIFSVDDATFNIGMGDPVAYNIYLDGKQVGKAGHLEYYCDFMVTGTHRWEVTAVYPDGQESAPAELVIDAISRLTTSGEPFDVYTTDGALVRKQTKSIDGLKSGVYIINGMKVIIN